MSETTWTASVISARLDRVGEGPRRVIFELVFRVLGRDDPGDPFVTLQLFPDQYSYRAAVFAGMTLAQIRDALLDTGIGQHPAWRDVGNQILADWDAAEILRNLPLPYEFGP